MNTQQELSTVLSVSAKTNYFSAIRPEYGIGQCKPKALCFLLFLVTLPGVGGYFISYFISLYPFIPFLRRAIVPLEMASLPSPKFSGYGAGRYGRLEKDSKILKSLEKRVRLGKLLTE